MDESTKKSLDALFANDQELKQKAQMKAEKDREERDHFTERFNAHRASVFEPALKEFADYIAPHGWRAEVKMTDPSPQTGVARDVVKQTSQIGLEFFKGSGLGGQSVPYFSLVCQPSSQNVLIHASTIGPNHGGSGGSIGPFTLEELDHAGVQSKLTEYFKRLMNDSRPFYERE